MQVVLPYYDKGSLQGLLRADALNDGRHAVPVATALHIARDVCAGMAYLERRRFVHR